ncbi:MAG: diaminopimelate epimerase [Eubacteriales bacterium]|nr:diaminopimelate epimerase [Eubacteriales bacterium]
MRFTKMHGIGNDYIYVNGLEETVENPEETSREISNRHFGVGSDGLIIIDKSEQADFTMRMWNSDGSAGKMCGNGIRCVAKYVYEKGLTDKTFLTIETGAGIKRLWLEAAGGRVRSVQVDMGEPVLVPQNIPTTLNKRQLKRHRVKTEFGSYYICTVGMGNPHGVVFVDDVNAIDIDTVGKALHEHEIFPDRCNIEFVEIISRNTIKMRVYERGAGETLACGTGACASVVAAVLNEHCDREIDVLLRGGTLHIEWCEADNHVFMRGPATFVCDGVWPFPENDLREKTEIREPINANPELQNIPKEK